MARNSQQLQNLALLMAFQCVRNNTTLEDMHCNGQISDPEMRAFMQGVVNNLYVMMTHLNEPGFVEKLGRDAGEITAWDRPALTGPLMALVKPSEP